MIGEAKTGPDLSKEISREQLVDFSTHRDEDGEHVVFWLCVPKGWKAEALAAIRDAGGETHDRVEVLEWTLPTRNRRPEPRLRECRLSASTRSA